jgi:hypothetical protein
MYIYNNEPQDIYTGEGNPLSSFIETAYFDLDEGKQLLFADRIIPDFSFTAGETIDISLNTKDYPNSTERTKGPFTISQNTTKVDMRTRGRQASVRLSATNTGGWRWGALRLSVQPDGDR